MDKTKCSVTSTWKTDGDKLLEDCVSWRYSEKSDCEEDDIYELISVDTCIQLRSESEKDKDPCQLTLAYIRPGYVINKIVVLSEARNIEIFGLMNEYVTTKKGEFVDKVDDDFIVYKTELVVPQPCQSHSYSLKFLGLRNTESMWLYGVHVILEHHSPAPTGTWKLDVSRISERLLSSKADVTDKAARMIHMISSFQQTQNPSQFLGLLKNATSLPHSKVSDMQNIASEIYKQAVFGVCKVNSQSESTIEKEHKRTIEYEDQSGGLNRGDNLQPSDRLHPIKNCDTGNSNSFKELLDKFQLTIQMEIAGLEDRLQTKMQKELAEISRKQDEILSLLQNKNSQ